MHGHKGGYRQEMFLIFKPYKEKNVFMLCRCINKLNHLKCKNSTVSMCCRTRPAKVLSLKKNVVLYNPFILTLSTMSYNCISFKVMQNVVFSHTCFILVYLNLTAISNQQTPTD